MLIYNSLVESRLRYGILSWSTATQKQLDRLRVLQNKALRFIHFASIDTSMLPIYSHYKVLPLSKLILHQQVTHMYSFENNLLPKAFESYCVKPSHSMGTRYSKNNYVLPKHGSKLRDKSIKIIGPQIWRNVPNDAKKLPFKKSFSRHMKSIYIDSLPKEMSKRKHFSKNKESNAKAAELRQIFFDETPTAEFLGFDLTLERILDSDFDSDSEFLGFDLSLRQLFDSHDDSDNEFYGFV